MPLAHAEAETHGEPTRDPGAERPAEAKRMTTDPAVEQARAELFGHRLSSAPSPAHALPQPIQRQMEQAFDADFSGVRVYEGEHVQRMDAEAYTRGEQLHFAPGRYAPHSPEGRRTLAHELAHVVQQREGRVRRGPESALNSDRELEAEADQMAETVSSTPSAPREGGGGRGF